MSAPQAEGKIRVRLIVPERVLLEEDVAMAVVPAIKGDMAVLSRRAPMVAELRPGVLGLFNARDELKANIFIAGGVIRIEDDLCTVLTEEAIPATEIDLESAKATLAEFKASLKPDASADEGNDANEHIAYLEMIVNRLAQEKRAHAH